MIQKITDDLWIDLDRLVRVDDGKYSLNFNDKVVTYHVEPEIAKKLNDVLQARLDHELQQSMMEILHDAT